MSENAQFIEEYQGMYVTLSYEIHRAKERLAMLASVQISLDTYEIEQQNILDEINSEINQLIVSEEERRVEIGDLKKEMNNIEKNVSDLMFLDPHIRRPKKLATYNDYDKENKEIQFALDGVPVKKNCYFSSGPGARVGVKLHNIFSYVERVDILIPDEPSVIGEEIYVEGCQVAKVTDPGQWISVQCDRFPSNIVLENEIGTLSFCEVQVYGYEVYTPFEAPQ
ncbi:uncharacterized protein LOC142357419 [Convolutriloba macropyga]|uniref:uncharacterized protein LOC142357419 n=1 Tax=Convolutriloba macropyga TaxID=536237 RepID=UPI003F51FA65